MRLRALPLVLAALMIVAIVASSALSTATKHALHTQGHLHPWLHLFVFALAAVLLLSSTRSWTVSLVFVVLLLGLGYATEAFESRRDGWVIELYDVRTDAIGVALGTALSLLPRLRSPNSASTTR